MKMWFTARATRQILSEIGMNVRCAAYDRWDR